MSDLLDTFQQRHQEKLDQLKRGEADEAFLDGIHTLIADLRQAGAVVADPAERGQLRALMHFWGNIVYDRTGVYPDTTLQPPDPTRARPPAEPTRRPLPPFAWMLIGGAAMIVIVIGLIAIMGRWHAPTPAPTSTPAPTPVPFVSYAAVGAGLDESGALRIIADTFCQGTPEIVAELALEGVQPETMWRWEVQRGGEVVASQPATPWGRSENRIAVPVLTGGSEGVEPGQYELLVYVGDQVVGEHPFRVLDTAPRVLNLRVTDVPAPTEGASGESRFKAGVRVIYLNYDYEGLCPGLDISHTLYREGEPIQESVETWSGASQGVAQVSFQAPGDLPFPSGNYEVTVAVAGEEQARVEFTLREETEVSPAFGGITIALGVQADGTPILPAPDRGFDWNTKVVYAIFDYVGMRDGLAWAAIWNRNGQEVAREEHFWDAETDGTAGTRWVAYYDERGRVLSGGTYSVTLYIENIAQRTAEFNVLYYVPSE